MTKKALITGITGQDGAYLAEFLLDKGYEVHGIKRRASLVQHRPHRSPLPGSARGRACRFKLHYGDLTDATNLIRIVQQVQPDEIYNLARAEPRGGVVRDAGVHGECRRARHAAPARGDPHPRAGEDDALLPGLHLRAVRQGAGDAADARRRRSTRARPMAWPSSTPTGSRSTTARPTACMPATASCSTTSRRCAARPSSPARSPAAWPASAQGLEDCLYLGNLDAQRDWGHARDYVEAQWLMLQQDEPEDFVIATGEQHSVREFVDAGRRAARLRRSSGAATGVDEQGVRPRDRQGAGAGRSALLPADRGGDAAGRPVEGARQARLGARGQLRGAGAGDGRGRPRQRAGATRTCSEHGLQGAPTAMSEGDRDLRRRPPRPGRLGASCASCERRGLRRPAAAHPRRARPARPGGGRGVLRTHERPDAGLPGRGQGRRHPRQRHLPGRLHPRQPADPDQRHRRGLARRACSKLLLPRLELHLPAGSRRSRCARTRC